MLYWLLYNLRGELSALVATASLELGIDIGDVDLVCQIGTPRAISTFLQRVGRSGHAVGGTPDHIHLAASFYPPFEIDRWIGEMKGASSHEFGKALQWQKGYGVVSFGTRDWDWVVAYIHNQKEHHRAGTIHERLERIAAD